jgi:predicted nucleic acid-binding protein
VADDLKVFFDTNVLVYAWDQHDRRKNQIARDLIRDLTKTQGVATLSIQVLQEFYSIVTSKFNADKLLAREMLLRYAQMNVVLPDIMLVTDAIDISVLSRISFWDALIIAAAKSARCSILYSEDMSHGQSIRGVRIVNPFA